MSDDIDNGNGDDELGDDIDRQIVRAATMDWRDYRRLLLYQVREARLAYHRLKKKLDKQDEKHDQQMEAIHARISKQAEEFGLSLAKQNTEIALLKFKSGMWGTIAGAVVAVGAMVIKKGGL
jgi:hypothetical protein